MGEGEGEGKGEGKEMGVSGQDSAGCSGGAPALNSTPPSV